MDLGKEPFESMEKYLPNRLHTMIKALPATWWQCMLIAGKEPTVFIFLIPNLKMAIHFFPPTCLSSKEIWIFKAIKTKNARLMDSTNHDPESTWYQALF